MLPVVSYFRQVNVFLVIETVGQSKPEGAWVFLSEVLGLMCIMDMSSNEDHCSSFLSFIDEVASAGVSMVSLIPFAVRWSFMS